VGFPYSQQRPSATGVALLNRPLPGNSVGTGLRPVRAPAGNTTEAALKREGLRPSPTANPPKSPLKNPPKSPFNKGDFKTPPPL